MNNGVPEDYREGLEKYFPNAKTRLDLLELQYGEDFADAIHDAVIFFVGAAAPYDEEWDGESRLKSFVRAALFSVDIEWLVAEVARLRGGNGMAADHG